MNILVVDVGGTHVKILASGEKVKRAIDSGPTLTARQMVSSVKKLADGWEYDLVSIGYPGPVVHVARLDYEPGESRTGLFGGNSNWRGPIWLPLNFLAIESLRHLHTNLGEDFTVELPTGSRRQASLEQVAEELERRLLRLFLRDSDGRRPALGSNSRFQRDGA